MPFSYSSEKRNNAISLREQGKSLRNIAKELRVSLSTVHLWTKAVVLSWEQKQKIAAEHRKKLIIGRDISIAKRKAQKTKRESKIFQIAKKEVQKRKSNPFFIMGLALYWAEGFKKDHSLGFVNSDPIMVQTFLKWLIVYGECKLENVRLRVQTHSVYKPRIALIQSYWSELLEIPNSQFQAPFYQISKSKPDFVDPEYRGLLRIRVIGARNLFIKILGWLEGLKNMSY